MKVKIGNRQTSMPKHVVIAHMANLLASRAVIMRKERDFKSAFLKYKNLCADFLRENKKFVFSFGEELWLKEFLEFEKKLYELLLQEVLFKFSDKTTWSISLNDLANLKILHEGLKKDAKDSLLSKPVDLVTWSQEKLTWDQIKTFAVIRKIDGSDELYNEEWSSVPKKVIIYSYDSESSTS